MTTKKAKSKNVGRPSKGDRTPVLLRIDAQILSCLDAYLTFSKEERSPFVQRLVMDHLMAKGFYPPKL